MLLQRKTMVKGLSIMKIIMLDVKQVQLESNIERNFMYMKKKGKRNT